MQLFEFCPLCTEPSTSEISNVVGTLIHVTQKCLSCSYARVWRSQPYIKKIPAGNLLLSAAILYSGSMISQTLRMLKILKVQCFSRQTYHKHQKNYLIPVVIKMWKEEQEKLVERVRNLGGGVVLLGMVDLTAQVTVLSMGHLRSLNKGSTKCLMFSLFK